MASTKVALVTGAGSGIGRAAARALLADGWNTVLVGRRLDRLESAVEGLEEAPGRAVAMACDIARPEQVEKLFGAVEAEFGRLDLLFNNAGLFTPAATIDELSLEAWHDALDVNLTGSFLCARAAFALMRRQKPMGGRIINNGSISAHAPRPRSIPYTTTKHAITGLTKSIALDGRPFDIACGQIDIGNALTELAAPIGQGAMQANGTVAPEATMDVEHVARSVLHMANLPLDSNVLFMTVMATKMPFVGRG